MYGITSTTKHHWWLPAMPCAPGAVLQKSVSRVRSTRLLQRFGEGRDCPQPSPLRRNRRMLLAVP